MSICLVCRRTLIVVLVQSEVIVDQQGRMHTETARTERDAGFPDLPASAPPLRGYTPSV